MNAQTPVHMMDAQAALGFVQNQRTYIEPGVLSKPYPEIKYPRLIPVDTSAPQWAPSVSFYTQDAVGKAKFINGKGDDIPLVNLLMSKYEATVNMAGIGYSFSLEEIGAAQQMSVNLSNDGAMAARFAYERLVDDVAFVGEATLGTEGLYNTTGITSVAAAATWSTATADQILADINGLLTGIMTASNGVEYANTLILPLASYGMIATKRIGPDTSMTVMDFIRQSNVYTANTGQQLVIEGDHRLTTKAVVYRRDPAVVKMHMPMPLTFIPPQARGLQIDVYGMFRFAPIDIRRPGAIRYLSGVA